MSGELTLSKILVGEKDLQRKFPRYHFGKFRSWEINMFQNA